MKILSTFFLILTPIFIFAQCDNPQACNFNANEECVFENNNDIVITDDIWLQEVDVGCDGTIDNIYYVEYFSNGTYNWGNDIESIWTSEATWSLCNNQFSDNYNYNGSVNSEGFIEGLIPSPIEPACDWACWRMIPVTSSDIYGCMDELACNYNSYANITDNSCMYEESCNSFNQVINNDNEICIVGCCQEDALNYDANVTLCNYSACIYLESLGPCEYYIENNNIPGFLVLGEIDENGECVVPGCTDVSACNYVPMATIDDESCFYAVDGYDCMNNCLEINELFSQDLINVELFESENCNFPIAELSLPNNWNVNSFGIGNDSGNDFIYAENLSNLVYGPFSSGNLYVDLNLSYQQNGFQECNVSSLGHFISEGANLQTMFNSFQNNICYITVENNFNVIYWNEIIPNITEYNIYRNNFGEEYELIGSTSNLSFTDTSSNSAQQSYKYKISGVDSCGIETYLTLIGDYNAHETIHLSSSLGVGGENNLSWNSYVGFYYETFQIYRSNNGEVFELINEIPSSNLSYSDISPPSGINEYFVSVTQTYPCENEISLSINSSFQNLNTLNSSASNLIQAITENASWECLNSVCELVNDGSGAYTSLFDCEQDCEVISSSWSCVDNSCVDPMDGTGIYSTLQECEAVCNIVIEDSWNCVNDACVDPMDGTGIYSNILDCELICNNTSTIEEQYFEYKVYPNPSNRIINVELDLFKSSDLQLSIVNYLGKVVFTEKLKDQKGQYNKTIDLGNNANGIYMLSITTNDQTINERIVIQ